jgi:hypothetical protein
MVQEAGSELRILENESTRLWASETRSGCVGSEMFCCKLCSESSAAHCTVTAFSNSVALYHTIQRVVHFGQSPQSARGFSFAFPLLFVKRLEPAQSR